MPLYEFESDDGQVIERLVSPGATGIVVDGKNFVRVVASTFGISGFATEPTQSDEIKRDCYKAECAGTFRSAYSKNQLRKVWGI